MIDVDQIVNFFTYDHASPLLYTSGLFWIFFTAILLFYSFIYRFHTVRSIYLLVFSLFFYYKTSGLFFILLIASCLINYTAGRQIGCGRKIWKRRLWLVAGLIFNLSSLTYFKYAYFFTESYNQLFEGKLQVINWLARWNNQLLGSTFDIDQIILPVGISFFTFQAISYLIDIYRKQIAPEQNLLYFSFYLSFFPQLIAGPIVRAATFLPQVRQKYRVSKPELNHAFFLIIKGLIKKVLISDYISVNFVDRVFDSPLSYSGIENLFGLYGYSLQIYCDFSGYTDIAIGLALLLGFRLPINFNSPYKAVNLADFWHRWHISLSTWLRDYLYIPLGGNRKGKLRMYINLMATMLLGGLWHGANIRFIIWGGIHGIGLVIQKLLSHLLFSLKAKAFSFAKYVGIFTTFHIVTFSWLFFRANDMQTINQMAYQVTHYFYPTNFYEICFSLRFVLIAMATGYIIHWLPERFKEYTRGIFVRLPIIGTITLFALTLMSIHWVSNAQLQPFIYFRF